MHRLSDTGFLLSALKVLAKILQPPHFTHTNHEGVRDRQLPVRNDARGDHETRVMQEFAVLLRNAVPAQ